MSEVVVLGSVNIDHIVTCAALPRPGETVLATAHSRRFGGKGGNQAAAAARLGAPTSLVAAIGDDVAGGQALADLSRYGVDVARVVTKTGAGTGEATVLVDDHGQNLIVVLPGANALLDSADVVAALGAKGLARSDALLASAEVSDECVAVAAQSASENGCRLIYNLAPARPLPRWLPDVETILVLNEGEAMQITGAGSSSAALETLASVIQTVVVTCGGDGVKVADGRERFALPAARVQVVDSTGAGDAFCGALAADLARGVALSDAVATAVWAGGVAVTALGARGALASR